MLMPRVGADPPPAPQVTFPQRDVGAAVPLFTPPPSAQGEAQHPHVSSPTESDAQQRDRPVFANGLDEAEDEQEVGGRRRRRSAASAALARWAGPARGCASPRAVPRVRMPMRPAAPRRTRVRATGGQGLHAQMDDGLHARLLAAGD